METGSSVRVNFPMARANASMLSRSAAVRLIVRLEGALQRIAGPAQPVVRFERAILERAGDRISALAVSDVPRIREIRRRGESGREGVLRILRGQVSCDQVLPVAAFPVLGRGGERRLVAAAIGFHRREPSSAARRM